LEVCPFSQTPLCCELALSTLIKIHMSHSCDEAVEKAEREYFYISRKKKRRNIERALERTVDNGCALDPCLDGIILSS
jgi:hypothetical protein